MSDQDQFNLDRLAAKHAQKIVNDTKKNGVKASDLDNTVTKALGVLQENGVYACFLYLLAREKDSGKVVISEMLKLLGELPFDWQVPKKNGKIDTQAEAVLPFICNTVTKNLERLLLVKETLEQMLIYARYGAKARG